MLHSATKFLDIRLELEAELNRNAPLTDWTRAAYQKIIMVKRALPAVAHDHESVALSSS